MNTLHIVVAMKPVEGTFAENALEHGVAGLNVDGCRIEGAVPTCTGQGFRTGKFSGRIGHGGTTMDGDAWENSGGRWPANVILDDQSAKALGEQSGLSKSSGGSGSKSGKTGQRTYGDYAGDRVGSNAGGLGDVGTAARFFKQVSEE